MSMYECHECGRHFDEPDIVQERHGLDTPPYEEIAVCPYCHGYFEEMSKCEVCGEYFCNYELKCGICEDCIDNSLTVENCYRWGDDFKEKIEINGFLLAIYSAEEIESLLYAHFKKNCLHKKLICQSFVNSTDFSYFADKIKEDNLNGKEF